jgi:tetratricopeptide (TPR) repeat protein
MRSTTDGFSPRILVLMKVAGVKLKSPAHIWQFKPRFRHNAFGWRSQPAITRVREACAEIANAARHDLALAAEGAVIFIERVSPALEHVDSSSGAIGSAVNRAIDELTDVIMRASVDTATRAKWLERLWDAYASDGMSYTQTLADYWGAMCASRDFASVWADRLIAYMRNVPRDAGGYGYSSATSPCLSALLHAERYDELFALLEELLVWWEYRRWGFQALARQGRIDEAVRYAEASRSKQDYYAPIARACEELLLSAGRSEEAYTHYAIAALDYEPTYVARYRALAKKYADKTPRELLDALVTATPGDEGKWFAAAKSIKLYDEAITLANLSPCDPKTLARAARDFADKEPAFAMEAGIAALRWIGAGHGYEITELEVGMAYKNGHVAADQLGLTQAFGQRVQAIATVAAQPWLRKALEHCQMYKASPGRDDRT